MKRSVAGVLFVAFLVTFVSCGQGEPVPVEPGPMERVENGLFLGAPVVGVPGASLEERMAAFDVPGVSIAVIQDYEIVGRRPTGSRTGPRDGWPTPTRCSRRPRSASR